MVEHDGRKLRVQHARSEEESSQRRKAAIERRAAAQATEKLEKKEKALADGEVIPEGAAKPRKKRAPRVSICTQERPSLRSEPTTGPWRGG